MKKCPKDTFKLEGTGEWTFSETSGGSEVKVNCSSPDTSQQITRECWTDPTTREVTWQDPDMNACKSEYTEKVESINRQVKTTDFTVSA